MNDRNFARVRTDARRLERDNVKRMNAAIAPGPDGEDHGLDLGPAALSRGSIQRVGGRIRGAGQRQAAPVYARIVDCSTLFERMNAAGQLSDRQAKAGHRALMLKRAAGLEPRVTARYATVEDKTVETMDDEEAEVESICPDGYEPRTWYRHVLGKLPSHPAHLIDRACDWTPEQQVGHPGTRFLATFQEGLDQLAKIFGFKTEISA